jgi:fucose permease
MTILQTAENPYITLLEPIECGAKHIAIMGIANKILGALSSLIFVALLLSRIDETKEKLNGATLEEKNSLLYRGRQWFYALSCYSHRALFIRCFNKKSSVITSVSG